MRRADGKAEETEPRQIEASQHPTKLPDPGCETNGCAPLDFSLGRLPHRSLIHTRPSYRTFSFIAQSKIRPVPGVDLPA